MFVVLAGPGCLGSLGSKDAELLGGEDGAPFVVGFGYGIGGVCARAHVLLLFWGCCGECAEDGGE